MHCWPAAAAAAVGTGSEVCLSVGAQQRPLRDHLLQTLHLGCAHTHRQIMGHRDKTQGVVSGHGVPGCIACLLLQLLLQP